MNAAIFIILITTIVVGFSMLYNILFATKKNKKNTGKKKKIKNYSRDIRIKKNGECKYPIEAKRLNIEAKIYIDLHIDKNGNIIEFQIPYEVKHGFEKEAYKYVRQWTFKPAILNNEPIDAWIRIPIQFRLERRIK